MIIDLGGHETAQNGHQRKDAPLMPPFWELERLIDGGCELETALALMSARRSRGSIASRWLPAGRDAFPILNRLAS